MGAVCSMRRHHGTKCVPAVDFPHTQAVSSIQGSADFFLCGLHLPLLVTLLVPTYKDNAGICVACLRNTVDITESVPKQATVNYCKGCNRYLSPPATWLLADLESRELLAICLRKLKGLKEVRLVDAGFVWTEPHSKRLRIKLTVQKEVSLRAGSLPRRNPLLTY